MSSGENEPYLFGIDESQGVIGIGERHIPLITEYFVITYHFLLRRCQLTAKIVLVKSVVYENKPATFKELKVMLTNARD